MIAESIALARNQQEAQRVEPTSSELALFDDVEAEHSVAAPEPEVVSILSQLCVVSSIMSIFAFLNDVPAFLGGGG